MADKIPFHRNRKAKRLDTYFAKEKMNVFQKRVIGGESDTVLYLTAIPAGPYRLPTVVVTDNSVYTTVRCRLGDRFIGARDEAPFLEFLRQVNARHAFFKYSINEEGTVYIDVCLPARDDMFDPEMVRMTLNLIMYHMQETYEELRKWLAFDGGTSS